MNHRHVRWNKFRLAQATALNEHRVLILKWYVDEQLDCRRIQQKLINVGCEFSYKVIVKFIRDAGVLRSVTEQNVVSGVSKHLRWKKTCEICHDPFESTTKFGRWCDVCVPKTSVHGFSARLWSAYAKKFGLTKAKYEELLHAQENACAVCHRAFKDMPTRNVHLDHCHETNQVRGILCLYCNRGIGCFFNNVNTLHSAAKYLSKRGK